MTTLFTMAVEVVMTIRTRRSSPARSGDTTQDEAEHFITVAEAATLLSRSTSTVYRMDRFSGPVRIIMKGRRVLVDRFSLQRLVEQRVGAVAPKGDDRAASIISVVEGNEHPQHRGTGQRELTWIERRPS